MQRERYIALPLGGRRGPLRGFAIIDEADWPLVKDKSWYLDASGYPQSHTAELRIRMHRLLTDPPEGMGVDHINGDKLDNRRVNLRLVTQAQNCQNVGTAKGPMRGVYLDSRRGRWYGQVKHLGKRHSTGSFDTPEEAAEAVRVLRAQILPYSVEREAA